MTEESNKSQFYTELEGEKVDIKISKVIEFLESLGYRKLKVLNGGYSLIKIKKKSIICFPQEQDVMQDIKEIILRQEDKPHVWEAFLKRDLINNRKFLAIDIIKDIELNPCTKNTAYFFFNNGILEATKDAIKLIPYESYEGYVFEDQIKNHDFSPINELGKSEFNTFLFNLSNKDGDRFRFLTSSLGFLIHGFKDSKLTKAVILVDEKLDFSGAAHGGTGKSLIGRAVRETISALYKDGKRLNSKGNKFFFQDIDFTHRVLNIDDVNKDFKFEEFFSVITENLTVEKKFKTPYTIPSNLSPKLLITSNYMIQSSGGNSDLRRRLEIEIAPYYNRDFTPFDEFNHRLFDDWDTEERNLFYNDMINYCQFYMANGIMYTTSINLEENKLISETSPAFVEFADSKIVFSKNNEVTIDKSELYTEFREKYPIESKNISIIAFKNYLDKWGSKRGYKLTHRKSNSKSLVDIEMGNSK